MLKYSKSIVASIVYPIYANKYAEVGFAYTPPFCPITISTFPLASVLSLSIHNNTPPFCCSDTSQQSVLFTVCPSKVFEKEIFFILSLVTPVPKNASVAFAVVLALSNISSQCAYNVVSCGGIAVLFVTCVPSDCAVYHPLNLYPTLVTGSGIVMFSPSTYFFVIVKFFAYDVALNVEDPFAL